MKDERRQRERLVTSVSSTMANKHLVLCPTQASNRTLKNKADEPHVHSARSSSACSEADARGSASASIQCICALDCIHAIKRTEPLCGAQHRFGALARPACKSSNAVPATPSLVQSGKPLAHAHRVIARRSRTGINMECEGCSCRLAELCSCLQNNGAWSRCSAETGSRWQSNAGGCCTTSC